jgi:hypothetical protein
MKVFSLFGKISPCLEKEIGKNLEKKFVKFFQSFNTKKKKKKGKRKKKKKTLINRQPYSKENNIRDANICPTRVKQPYQMYIKRSHNLTILTATHILCVFFKDV